MKDKEKLINDEAKKADDVKKEKRCHDEDMCRVSGGNENLNEMLHKINVDAFQKVAVAYGGPDYFGENRKIQGYLKARQEKQNLYPKDKSFPENNSDSSKK